MLEKILTTDVQTRWPDILTALSHGEHEIIITDGTQVQAVIMDRARYRQLVTTALREERRQRALALPLAVSPDDWKAGFDTLERVSEKFADLSDDDLDSLFGSTLADIRDTTQE